ncbi:MAG: aspartate kinase [Thermovirgaceae bacterium]|jgi:aspartate kinase|nr:aspartate kinase [Synergistales bacterium]MDI9393794.1 aspartate kinase [Synergistota bacterium]NLV65613.1 aspartate kinase [Synergistaceae bacterium]HRW88077.1 aspartate kinase [Thermovirgaceae bacterium]MDD5515470.1 aspartate kinase [Synergistales bacterium]
MKIEVLKFGGSSLFGEGRIEAVAGRAAERFRNGVAVAVVVSAVGHTTDSLMETANGLTTRLNRREMDQLISTGEQQSVALLTMALGKLGIPARSFSGWQNGITACGVFGDGRISSVNPRIVAGSLERGEVAVVAGFQGVTEEGDVITLGRGGSDLSAVALAAALEADSCRIYTDVEGIFSADPRVVPKAFRLERISCGECMEMAAAGARVLQARSVELAWRYEVPVFVGSSFERERGTWIMREDVSEGFVVRSITHDTGVAKVAVLGVPDTPGIAARVFSPLSEAGVGAEMIIQSVMRGQVNDIAFLVRKEFLGEAIDICRGTARDIGAQGVVFDTEIGKISLVGAGLSNHPEAPARMFSILAAESVNIDMISSTSMSITCVVSSADVEKAAVALHRVFIEGVPA